MKNVFLVGMLVGIGFVFFGLQRANHSPQAQRTPAHVHDDEAGSSNGSMNSSSQSAAKEAVTAVFDTSRPGYQVYMRKGCQRCHGPDLLGTRMAPALVDARKNFDKASLGEYLADPAAYTEKDPRLKAQAQRYRMQQMPSTQLSDDELDALAGLILGNG